MIVLTAAARIQWSGPLAESIVLAMSSLKALALTVVSSCALLATDGCGKSGGKGATSDAAPGDATGADAATVGSGGAGGTGGGKDASFGGTGGVSYLRKMLDVVRQHDRWGCWRQGRNHWRGRLQRK